MTPETKVRRDGWLYEADGEWTAGGSWGRVLDSRYVPVVVLPTEHYEAALVKLATVLCGHSFDAPCDLCLETVRTTLEET